jgi:hypothetical protein
MFLHPLIKGIFLRDFTRSSSIRRHNHDLTAPINLDTRN